MALNPTRRVDQARAYRDLARILMLIVGVIVFVAALNLAFGMPHVAPTYEIVPDPAGPLPF